MLALTLLWRNWRSGELKLLSIAIVLAVAVLSGIAVFTDRLDSTLLNQSNSLLGADIILASSKPLNAHWLQEASARHIAQTQTLEFGSMVYAGDEMHLAAIKAVSQGYPLRGQIDTSQIAFAMKAADITRALGVPAPGEVWVDSRLLPQLNIKIGDKLAIGELELKVAQILIREPESVNPFSALAPRILMNAADVAATQVIQPGSNLTYSWLLASDSPQTLEAFTRWLKPQLSKHERLEDIASSQERLGSTLKAGKNFLLLAAVIAVLLAGVAIAIAARQFSERHTAQVALMKSLGASAFKIRRLYFGQLFILGILAAFLGLIIGHAIQAMVAVVIHNSYQLDLQGSHLSAYVFSFLSGLICVTFFALPALWFLPAIPPLKIMRRELAVNRVQLWLQSVLALLAVVFLVALFSADLKLTLIIALALMLVVLISLALSYLLLALSKILAGKLGGFWRLAFSQLQRHRGQTLLQMMVFAIAIMLLAALSIVRSSLISDWQRQLPVNAPNHFLVNIPPAELQDVATMLADQKVEAAPLYPMIRGRLILINAAEPSEELVKKANALQREVNLTQAAVMAGDNKLLAGEWWDKWHKGSLPGVSVESDTARNLGVKVGDNLRFSLGGLLLDAQVASIRSVEWKSMRPNFFFIFEPGALDAYSPTFMTSIYLAPEQKLFINQLLRKHPTLMVMELDRVIEQMHRIINQVSNGIQLVLLLTLMAGSLVLLAAVMSSVDNRKQEAGLLRALGCSRQLILGSVFAEFVVLGISAGIIATLGAEALLFSLQKFIMHNPVHPHYSYWVLTPLISAIFISGLGVICCRPVVTTPPAVVLRDAV